MAAESRHGRVVTAAPNFAYEWTAQRGLPAQDADVDLGNVVLIIGSETVSIDAVKTFTEAFTRYGLPPTAIKPSYGMAEATLFVSTIDPTAQATAVYLDREQLGIGRAVRVAAETFRVAKEKGVKIFAFAEGPLGHTTSVRAMLDRPIIGQRIHVATVGRRRRDGKPSPSRLVERR